MNEQMFMKFSRSIWIQDIFILKRLWLDCFTLLKLCMAEDSFLFEWRLLLYFLHISSGFTIFCYCYSVHSLDDSLNWQITVMLFQQNGCHLYRHCALFLIKMWLSGERMIYIMLEGSWNSVFSFQINIRAQHNNKHMSTDWPKSMWDEHSQDTKGTWWRHQMETFSALLVICAGNAPVPGEFPAQRPVTRSFGVFFYLHQNKRLRKQSWSWWFETLWYLYDVIVMRFVMIWRLTTLAALVLALQVEPGLIFNEVGFQIPAPFQCRHMVQNVSLYRWLSARLAILQPCSKSSIFSAFAGLFFLPASQHVQSLLPVGPIWRHICGQHWFKWRFVASTWTNADLLSMKSRDIHLRTCHSSGDVS